MAQLCRLGRILVNLLLTMNSDTEVTEVSWSQWAATVLLEEVVLPSSWPLSQPWCHQPTTLPVPAQESCSRFLNHAIRTSRSRQSETGLFSASNVLFRVRSEQEGWTAAGGINGLCLAYWSWCWGVRCRQTFIYKTYKLEFWTLGRVGFLYESVSQGFKTKLIGYIWT